MHIIKHRFYKISPSTKNERKKARGEKEKIVNFNKGQTLKNTYNRSKSNADIYDCQLF